MLNQRGIARNLLAVAAAATSVVAATAHAQTGARPEEKSRAEPAEGEIIVTALKRSSPLEKVPTSVAVVQGSDIRGAAIGGLDELSKQIPNVNVQQAAENNFIFIRGAGSGINEGFEQSVGLFVDGVYSGRSRQFLVPFLDVERVEFLKGPQGVVLGKNTIAGAISIVTARPTPSFEAGFIANYDMEPDLASIEGHLSGPLSKKVGFRLAGKVGRSSGFLRNTANGEREAGERSWALRASLQAEVGEDFTAFVKVEGGEFRQRGVGSQISILGPGASVLGLLSPGHEDPKFAPGLADDRKSMLAFRNSDAFGLGAAPHRYDREFDNTRSLTSALTLDYDLGTAAITSVTGFSTLRMGRVFDSDYGPLPLIIVDTPSGRYRQFSQEVRVASPAGSALGYLVGAYFQHQKLGIDRNEHIAGTLLGAADFSTFRTFDQKTSSLAAFGQLSWRVSPSFRINGGLRYTHESKRAAVDYDILPFLSQSASAALSGATPETLTAAAFGLAPASKRGSRRYADLSPSLSAELDLPGAGMLYASYARGYKAGGFNEQVSNPSSSFAFAAETATALEVGAKFKLMDGALRVNLAAFHTSYGDLQVTAFNGLTFDVGNAAKSRARGLEFDAVLKPARGWTIGAAAAYLDSTFRSFPNGPAVAGTPGVQDLSGRPTLFAPRWTLDAHLAHERDAGPFTLFVRGDVRFVSAQYYQLDLDPADRQPAYATIDAKAGVRLLSPEIDLSLIVKNLTNKRAALYSFDVPVFAGTHGAFVNPPRSLILQLGARF